MATVYGSVIDLLTSFRQQGHLYDKNIERVLHKTIKRVLNKTQTVPFVLDSISCECYPGT